MTVPSDHEVPRRFRWPSDYYASPAPEAVLPRWLTFGCGIAAAVALLVIFIGGAFATRGGFVTFMDFAISMSMSDVKAQYAPDVPPERRKSMEAEVTRMRESFRAGKISVAALQPFLETLRDVSGDGRVTAEEVARLEKSARTAADRAGAKLPAKR